MKKISMLFIFLWTIAVYSQDLPNILWIVSEDNSPFIGAYGDTFATTPHLDQFAQEGILYTHAFATAPVCAPARSSIITGVYSNSMGTQHMRSYYPIPDEIRFFPEFLRQKGYYTTNNSKTDYNTSSADTRMAVTWDESSGSAHYKNRKPGQPFFAVFNTNITHESSIHKSQEVLRHPPNMVPIPPYHPQTDEMKRDWAQYYDKVEDMDAFVGNLLKELEELGQAENTIVFYYSDHGGILGRSKRYLYDSGLHVPLMIRFPERFKHLSPLPPGAKSNRMVSFVDFAPTVLNLAGIPAPEYMQGQAFLGSNSDKERTYAFSFRGRMDERPDMSRSVRDGRFRYTRNFLPQKIYGQYLEYLWRAPSLKSWETAYQEGQLNAIQSAFWEKKPIEELYDCVNDPHNVNNLAKDPKYQKELGRLRKACTEWMINIHDLGLMPESYYSSIGKKTSLYEYGKSEEYNTAELLNDVQDLFERSNKSLSSYIKREKEPLMRYWAIVASMSSEDKYLENALLMTLLQDSDHMVRIAAAEALLLQESESDLVTSALIQTIQEGNPMIRVNAINLLNGMEIQYMKRALPTIKSILQDREDSKDYDVRSAQRFIDLIE